MADRFAHSGGSEQPGFRTDGVSGVQHARTTQGPVVAARFGRVAGVLPPAEAPAARASGTGPLAPAPELIPEPVAAAPVDGVQTLTVPARLRRQFAGVAVDGVVTAPDLTVLQARATGDPEALAFVRTLTTESLVRVLMPEGETYISIYPAAKAGPQDVCETIPQLARQAARTFVLRHFPYHLLDEAITSALIGMRKRGVQVRVEVARRQGAPKGDRNLRERLEATGVEFVKQVKADGPEGWRTLLPEILRDGTNVSLF